MFLNDTDDLEFCVNWEAVSHTVTATQNIHSYKLCPSLFV